MPKTTINKGGDQERIAVLANDADTLDREREVRLAALLDRLDALEPELVRSTIEAFGDRHRAALWLARPNRSLGGISPYRAIASGQRQMVLDVLGRIEHGVFS
jgi:uncharacterized protein (DUF2384 family)